MKLVLVADPMCSWCYGFGKEMTSLLERHKKIKLDIVVGGLRAGATDILDEAGKRFRLQHWARVEQLSGLVFNRDGLMTRRNFVYDTGPICRAVVAARVLAPKCDLLKVFRALQRAFYVDALDTTDGTVLAEVGAAALSQAGYPVGASEFLDVWRLPSTIDTTHAEFERARRMGVTSFPTLFVERGNGLARVGDGYAQVAALEHELGLPAQA